METHSFAPVVIIKTVHFPLKGALVKRGYFVSNGPDTCLLSPPLCSRSKANCMRHSPALWGVQVTPAFSKGNAQAPMPRVICAAKQKHLALLPCAKPKHSNSTCCLCPFERVGSLSRLPRHDLGKRLDKTRCPSSAVWGGTQFAHSSVLAAHRPHSSSQHQQGCPNSCWPQAQCSQLLTWGAAPCANTRS